MMAVFASRATTLLPLLLCFPFTQRGASFSADAFVPLATSPSPVRSLVDTNARQSRWHTGTHKPTHLRFSDSDADGAPDPSILISAKDDRTQQLAFGAAFGALAVGTTACIQLWYGIGMDALGEDFFQTIRSTIFPIAFGTIFALVGVLHFVFVENFARIVPPKGTWGGLWQAPAPFQATLGVTYEEYHSYWTGVAEFVGGIWLLAGGLGLASTEVPAWLLFALTVGVTPANLYMFTHDANPGGAVPRLQYPFGHVARFVVQCGLLSNFYIMSNPP